MRQLCLCDLGRDEKTLNNHRFFASTVIASAMRKNLDDASKKIGLGHKVFSRPLVGEHNTIVRTLDSILTKIGDDSAYVEYWIRQEWRSIEAHADVDEFLAKRQDLAGNTNTSDFRYPTNGHVLYLKVGSSVRGPTCVFPGTRSGKDLRSSEVMERGVDLVVVPAVSGRLLRFGGDCLHAVPRPADLWLLKFVQGAAKYDPEDEWGRSVILFNTWDEAPLDVPTDSVVEEENCLDHQSDICNQRSEWHETYNFWAQTIDNVRTLDDSEVNTRIPVKIWLLGNFRRRGHEMRTLSLSSPPNLLEALHEITKITHVLLGPNDT